MGGPTPDHLAATINAFNNLMKSLIHLSRTLAVAEAAFEKGALDSAIQGAVTNLVAVVGGVGLAAAGIIAAPIAVPTVAAAATTAIAGIVLKRT